MELTIKFTIDTNYYAKKFENTNPSMLGERVCLLLEEDIVKQIKDYGFQSVDVYRQVVEDVENKLRERCPEMFEISKEEYYE